MTRCTPGCVVYVERVYQGTVNVLVSSVWYNVVECVQSLVHELLSFHVRTR